MAYSPPAVYRLAVFPVAMIPDRPPAAILAALPIAASTGPIRPLGGIVIPAALAGTVGILPLIVPGAPIIQPILPMARIPAPRNICSQMNFTTKVSQNNILDQFYTEVQKGRNGNVLKRTWTNITDQSPSNKTSNTIISKCMF